MRADESLIDFKYCLSGMFGGVTGFKVDIGI